jgi:amino acid adenylation domain-containing protein
MSECGYLELAVPELLSLQAEKTPDRIALRYRDDALTFRELNARANQFAGYLKRQGAGEENLVGLCCERSVEAIISIFGILKAGGAYLLLDPAHPQERLQQIIKASGLSILLASSKYRDHLAADRVTQIDIEDVWDDVARESAADTRSGAGVDSLAYVSYTSGSTGEPKGVMSTHRSIINGLAAVPFDKNRDDEVCSLNTPLASGFTVSRLFLPLLSGTSLVIIPETEASDPFRLVAALERANVTSAAVVTSVLRQILDAGHPATSRLQKLRTLTVGGSAVSAELIEAFRFALPQATLLNGYAASEIGGAAIVWTINASSAADDRCIGQPFPNTDIYVVDEDLHQVAPGETGEICVAALHLARGYLNRPDLTAERFLENPFSGRYPRMYRTGDRGRLFSDGRIELLGRVDFQVKVGGYRVELEEVEAVFQRHDAVREIVIVPQETNSETRLVAYVVAERAVDRFELELRRYGRSKLPDYMVPGVFMVLPELPRTPAGKVDRQALMRRAVKLQRQGVNYEAPRTPTEADILTLWQEVLGIEPIGRHESFMELGGDSLRAVQLMLRVCEHFQIDLPLITIYVHPTVAEIAAHVSSIAGEESRAMATGA